MQTIAFMADLNIREPVSNMPYLVVCPLSVLPSWQNECKRWAPALKIETFYGSYEAREAKKPLLHNKGNWNFDILLTTYETALASRNL